MKKLILIIYIFLFFSNLIFGEVIEYYKLKNDFTKIKASKKMKRKLTKFRKKINSQAKKFAKNFYLTGDLKKKIVALTFDDAPDSKYTDQVLKILKKNKIKASFFVLGLYCETHKECLKRVYNDGHYIGNHSYNHKDFRKLFYKPFYHEQIKKTGKIIKDIIGKTPLIIRPPYGAIKDNQIDFLQRQKYKVVNWSLDSFDWYRKENDPENMMYWIKKYLHNGAIILMHSGGGNRSNTVTMLPNLIKYLKDNGYTFQTVPELLKIDGYFEDIDKVKEKREQKSIKVKEEKVDLFDNEIELISIE